jgi:hypothetical protein
MTEGRAENKYGFDMQVSERHMAKEFFRQPFGKSTRYRVMGTAIEA